MVSLVHKGVVRTQKYESNNVDNDLLEKSRKLVLRCYNTIASHQELSGVQVAMYLMGLPDHYTNEKYAKFCLISIERYVQICVDESRKKINKVVVSNESRDI